MEVALKQPVATRLTVAEYRNLEFDDNDPYLYELIDGELVKRSAPTPYHQRISRELTVAVHLHVKQHELGEVFYAPIDVFLDEYNAPQPDLVFVPKANEAIVTGNGIEGIPALVVEILSPSSVVRDRKTKWAVYERSGVDEYWLVDPANQEVEVYTLENSRYELFSAASAEEGVFSSKTLADLNLELKQLFA